MAGLNKVMLIGRIGKDPEVISFENGSKKVSFSLATSDHYRDKEGNWQEQTEWHNIVVWGILANDIADKKRNYIKGDLMYIEGKIKSRQYKDSQDVTRYITEINADRLNMIMKAGQGNSSQTEHNAAAPYTKTVPEQHTSLPVQEGDDLPF
ncbi:MAG: single-stranded DNA-binding protein [Bacteroidales bacterium]|nr:single-stranded DNA-binding protein [Bacteroidales bacterium]